MIQYPSFDAATTNPDGVFHIFDKLDGSNVRAEWTRKASKKGVERGGLVKFGKRSGLLDDQTPFLAQAKDCILDQYADALDEILRGVRGLEQATVFFEFFGPNSAFGVHYDEPHKVVLIDAHFYKQGFLSPKDFLKTFGGVEHATLIEVGRITQDLREQVFNGTLPGVTFEGVVAKGNPTRSGPQLYKMKSRAWYEALRAKCADAPDPEAAFDRLA